MLPPWITAQDYAGFYSWQPRTPAHFPAVTGCYRLTVHVPFAHRLTRYALAKPQFTDNTTCGHLPPRSPVPATLPAVYVLLMPLDRAATLPGTTR